MAWESEGSTIGKVRESNSRFLATALWTSVLKQRGIIMGCHVHRWVNRDLKNRETVLQRKRLVKWWPRNERKRWWSRDGLLTMVKSKAMTGRERERERCLEGERRFMNGTVAHCLGSKHGENTVMKNCKWNEREYRRYRSREGNRIKYFMIKIDILRIIELYKFWKNKMFNFVILICLWVFLNNWH